MLIADDLPTLTRQVERIRKKLAEQNGERKAILKKIKEKYKVTTVDEAENLYKKRLARTHTMLQEDIKEREAFDKKYGDKLNGT